jgi:hypothetical protein
MKRLVIGIFLCSAILFIGFFWLQNSQAGPRPAPEADRVLNAQAGLPFQVLIPAYLPRGFERENLLIFLDETGPNGEALIQLTYPTHWGNKLVLREWIPSGAALGAPGEGTRRCVCLCVSRQQCETLGVELDIGRVRVSVRLSIPDLISAGQLQFVLDTLGPAANRQIYTKMAEVPASVSAPPPVEVATNAEGVQELTLVVTPEGYMPAHFAVQKGVPVRLIFRQLGQVGCGNELIFSWGEDQSATLILASPDDKQVLEFIPPRAGEFPFYCPHQIYRGWMTVKD